MKRMTCKSVITKYLLTLVLVASIILTSGCGEDAANGEATATPEAESEVVEHERALDVEDGTMSAESTVISVGQTPVSYREYMTYYYFMENQYNSLLSEEVWKQHGEDDKTIGQEAIEDVLRMIIQVKVIAKQSEHLGIALEADEKEDADYNAQKLFDSISQETRDKYFITAAQLMRIFEENRLAKKVYNVITGQVDIGLTPSEAQAYRVQLIFKAAQADKDKPRAEMEKLQSTIASSEESFYYFAKHESEADTIETVVGALDERRNLWNTIISIKPDTVSSVVEENDGFYIVYVIARPDDALNTEYQNEVIANRQTTAFQDQYATWSRFFDVAVSDSLLSD